jgi:hypothetical protein
LGLGFFGCEVVRALDREEKFDTSGKSPAYEEHRSDQARAGKPTAGLLSSTAARK